MWTTGCKQNENCETQLVPASRESCEGQKMTVVSRSSKRRTVGVDKLDADDAFIALLIAAMDTSGHVSAEEAARAHNIIWSMRRFRHRPGETVGRKVERMRTLVEKHGASPVIEGAARQIPKRRRGGAFAMAADLVLVDGRMERSEGRFLRQLAADLGLDRQTAKSILDVIRLKNSA
jgi:tellurite resistance protein